MSLSKTNGVLALSVCCSICLEGIHRSIANHNIWHVLTSWKPPSVYQVVRKDCLAQSWIKLYYGGRKQFRQNYLEELSKGNWAKLCYRVKLKDKERFAYLFLYGAIWYPTFRNCPKVAHNNHKMKINWKKVFLFIYLLKIKIS